MPISLITSKDILDSLNKCLELENIQGSKYYIFKENANELILSNIPQDFYKKELKKYSEINGQNCDNEEFIKLIKYNIDYFQEHAGPDKLKLFKCFENSTIIFDSLGLLDKKENNINSEVKIVYGFISRKIPIGTSFNNEVLLREGLIIHDWHVWNYINNFIIDVTLLKNGSIIGIDENITWGKADDHVFLNAPNNTDYFGIEFNNYDEFIKDFRITLGV